MFYYTAPANTGACVIFKTLPNSNAIHSVPFHCNKAYSPASLKVRVVFVPVKLPVTTAYPLSTLKIIFFNWPTTTPLANVNANAPLVESIVVRKLVRIIAPLVAISFWAATGIKGHTSPEIDFIPPVDEVV